MSYAIGNLIYGLPVTGKLADYAEKHDIELEELGFELLYSAGAEPVGYLGFECMEFDECTDIFRFSEMEEAKLKVTPAIRAEVEEQIREFSYTNKELSQILIDEGVVMDYYIVWSSS